MNELIVSDAEFEEIYEKHKDAVLQTAMLFVNRHTAEDIVQEVFLKFHILMRGSNVKNIRGWLMIVAKNMALNYIRKEKKETLVDIQEVGESLFGQAESTEDIYFGGLPDRRPTEYGNYILDHLYEVNTKWFEAILLTYCMGKQQKEVAEIMELSLEAVYSMLYRAKRWIEKNYNPKFVRGKAKKK